MPAGTLVRLSPTITGCLQRLRLRPWRHAEPQHLAQGPHVVGQSRRHGWRPQPPLLGRAVAVDRLGLG
jgi:hypothetical protein